jgi:ubiquinone/menaquinone biosynthesis C-methylase UbiE
VLREVYDRRAELHYAAPAAPDPGVDRKFERLRAVLLARLPARAVLDAGCGDGRYLAALAEAPGTPQRVVGVDISERILGAAELAAEAAGVGAELVRANLEALPFADGEFDLVLSVQVVEHLLDPAAGLGELARVLEPGGTLIVSTDHARAVVSRLLNAPRALAVRALRLRRRRVLVDFPHRTFGLDEFVSLVQAAGLEVEHRETFRFTVLPPLGRPWVLRALNRLERALPPHRLGDIVLVVARKPEQPK